MQIADLVNFLEFIAPPSYQEDYDNSGLIIGNKTTEISAVLVSLDVTLEILNEAISKKCNVIVAHHPLIFKGLKKINGKSEIENCVIKAIKNDIAIYAIHTNLDNVAGGVNFKIAEKLGLKNIKVLRPKAEVLNKLTVFVPINNSQKVQEALFEAGAGNIGNYANCSFKMEGIGTFLPKDGANPTLGTLGIQEYVSENRIEVIFPSYLQSKILMAMKNAHPYEEVAYYLQSLENVNEQVGSGAVGSLDEPMEVKAFLDLLKVNMNAQVIRHTHLCHQKISRVAVCGGVGSFLLPDAIAAGAEVFVSADFKYHEFFDAENKIIIADIGHFESEQYTKDLLVEQLSKKFANFTSYLSEIDTNPIKYFK